MHDAQFDSFRRCCRCFWFFSRSFCFSLSSTCSFSSCRLELICRWFSKFSWINDVADSWMSSAFCNKCPTSTSYGFVVNSLNNKSYNKLYKKSEPIPTRRAKAYSSSCSQTVVYLQSFRRSSFLKCALQPKIAKIKKTLYFKSSGSYKVIGVDIRLKSSSLVLVVACPTAHAYLQPFSRKTGQQW